MSQDARACLGWAQKTHNSPLPGLPEAPIRWGNCDQTEEVTVAVAAARPGGRPPPRDAHPIARLVRRRLAIGVLTCSWCRWWCSWPPRCCPATPRTRYSGATPPRPGCGRSRSPLHLNRGLFDQYWIWISGLFTGNLGHSLVNGQPVWSHVEPRLVNSAVLVFVTGAIGSLARRGPRRHRRAAQGRLVRPRHVGRRAGGDVAPRVRRGHRPDHPAVHRGLARPARRSRCCPRAPTPGASRNCSSCRSPRS